MVTWRCKSSGELVVATQANRKARETEPSARAALKEAASEPVESRDTNRIEGTAKQGERAGYREALTTKRSGVNPATVRGRPSSLPGETSPYA